MKGMQIRAKKNASSQVFSHAYCLWTRSGKANAPPATAARRINPKPGICGFINNLFSILLWNLWPVFELPRDYSTTRDGVSRILEKLPGDAGVAGWRSAKLCGARPRTCPWSIVYANDVEFHSTPAPLSCATRCNSFTPARSRRGVQPWPPPAEGLKA